MSYREDEIFEGLSSMMSGTADLNRWILRVAETKRMSPDRLVDIKRTCERISLIADRIGEEA